MVDLTLTPKSCRAIGRGVSAVINQYELTERERGRLSEIARQPGMAMNCALARGNRLELIVGSFPKTCTLLKPLLPRLLDELWEQRKPDNYQLFGEEDAFAAFIAEKISRNELAVEYLSEIFVYELTCRDLEIRVETCGDTNSVFEAIVEFRHAPDELLGPLNNHAAPPPGLPSGIFPARLRMSEAGFEMSVLPVWRG
jgi:hypothetical protein